MVFCGLRFIGPKERVDNHTGGGFQRLSKRMKNLLGLHQKAEVLEMSEKFPSNENVIVSVLNDSDDIVKAKVLTDITNRSIVSSNLLPSVKTSGNFFIS